MTAAAIRPTRTTDLPVLTALERDLFGSDAWTEQSVQGELTAPGARLLVAADPDGTVLGYVSTRHAGETADLLRIAVAPSARRLGLGRRLLQRAVDEAAAAGCDQMLLEVSAANAGALALYAAEGFVEVARRPGYYRDGSAAVVMRRPLRQTRSATGGQAG